MKKKQLIIVMVIIIGVSIGGGFGLSALSRMMHGSGDTGSTNSIIGDWTEDSTGVTVTLTEDNVFKIMGSEAAKFTNNAKDKTIIFVYAQSYGGQTVNMTYTITDSKLTMTNVATGEKQTYTKADQVVPTTNPTATPEE